MPEDRIMSWGQSWNPGIKPSRGLDCPFCGWGFVNESSSKKYNQIIGFSNQIPFKTRGLGIRILIGILIVECPECFDKYCFHTDASFIRSFRDFCDNWPKNTD